MKKHVLQFLIIITLLVLGGVGLYLHVEYSGWLVFFGVLAALDFL